MKQMGLIAKRVQDLGYLAQGVTQIEPVDPRAMGASLVIGELTDREVRHHGKKCVTKSDDARKMMAVALD